MCTVVPATAGPLGEQPPALAGHFCNVPTAVFAVLMSLYPAATCHEGPLSLRTGGGRSWQVLLYLVVDYNIDFPCLFGSLLLREVSLFVFLEQLQQKGFYPVLIMCICLLY